MTDLATELRASREGAAASRHRHPSAAPDERRLALGVFRQALLDLTARTSGVNPKLRRRRRRRATAAREWISEAGPGFRFWSTAAGLDWRATRAGILEEGREGRHTGRTLNRRQR